MNKSQKRLLDIFIASAKNRYRANNDGEEIPVDMLQKLTKEFMATDQEFIDAAELETQIIKQDGVEVELTDNPDEQDAGYVSGEYSPVMELDTVVLGTEDSIEEIKKEEEEERDIALGVDAYTISDNEGKTKVWDLDFYNEPAEIAAQISKNNQDPFLSPEQETELRNKHFDAVQSKVDYILGLKSKIEGEFKGTIKLPYTEKELFRAIDDASYGSKKGTSIVNETLKAINEKIPQIQDSERLFEELVDISDLGLEESKVNLFEIKGDEEQLFIQNNPHMFNFINNKENDPEKLRELIKEKTGIDPEEIDSEWFSNPDSISGDKLDEILSNKDISKYANILNYYSQFKKEHEKGNIKPIDANQNAEEDLAEKIFAYKQLAKNPNLSDEDRELALERFKRLSTIQKEYNHADQSIWDAKYAPGFTDAKFYGDLLRRFAGTGLDILAGVAETPSYVNKLMLNLFQPNLVQSIEDAYSDDQQGETEAINLMVNRGNIVGAEIANISTDIGNWMRGISENITEDAFKYRGSLLDQIEGSGLNFNDIADVAANLTQKTVESLPYMVTSALSAYGMPIGLVMIGTSTAANTEYENNNAATEAFIAKMELDPSSETYEKDVEELDKIIASGDINGRNLMHSIVVGTTNSVLERFSGKIGRSFIAAAKGQTKEQIERGLRSYFNKFLLNSAGEGGTEGFQTAIEKLSEYLVQGKEVEFNQALKEVIEATIIGTSSGGLVTGGAGGSNIVYKTIRSNQQNKIIKNSGFTNAYDLFQNDIVPADQDVDIDTDIDVEASSSNLVINESQILFAQIPGSELRLQQELDLKIKEGEITIERGTEIQNNYRDIQGATNLLKKAKLEKNVEAVNLMVEKKKLEDRIEELKQVSPEAASSLTVRVEQINKKLATLTTAAMNDSRGIAATQIVPGITQAIDFVNRKQGEDFIQTELETDTGVNELLLKTIKNPDTKRSDVNQATESLIENNKPLYYKAIGFDPVRGDISGKEVMDIVKSKLGPIIKNFDPSQGVKWSTYVTNSLNKKRQEIYQEAGIGQQNISLDAEGAMQVADTQVETNTQQDVPQRPKVYPSQVESVAKILTPEVRETQNTKVKDEIIRSVNDKGITPKDVATDIIGKTKEKEIRNVIKSAVGKFGSKTYNDFVDTIDQNFINSLPLSTIKGRFGKLFGIEEVSRTATKNVREGKKDSNFKKQVFKIPKTTPETIQKIKDYFKKNEKRSQSLFSLLAEGVIVEEIQTLKGDTEFMKKLNDVLEIKGSKQTAEQFMDQLEKDADQRTKEDTSFDIVEDVIDDMISDLDGYIKSMEGTLAANPITPIAKIIRTALKTFKTVYQKTKSFAKAFKAAKDYIVKNTGLKSTEVEPVMKEAGFTKENIEGDAVDVQYLIDEISALTGFKRDKAYEQLVINNAIELSKRFPGLKVVLKKPSEKGRYRNFDFAFELNGIEFLGESKLENAQYSSVNGTYDFSTNKFKFTKDYYSPELQAEMDKLVKKNEPNLKAWAKGIKNQGVNLTTSSKKIPLTAWNNNQDADLQKPTTVKQTMDANIVSELYNKKQPPVYYINIKGQGLFYMGQNPLGLDIPALQGSVDMVFRFKRSKTDDNGNVTPTLAFVPANLKSDVKSKYDLGNPTSFGKLIESPTVQKLLKSENVARQNNANIANDIITTKQSPSEVKQTFVNSQDARFDAQKVNKETKGLSAFDFDDTLALTKEKVLYTMPDGTTGELTAGEFAVQAEELTTQGVEFDFSNFEDVNISTLEGPMVGEAKKKQKKFGPKDIFVVTARPGASVDAVHTFLKSIGLNIPKANITALGNGEPQAKADWFLNKAAEGYNDFYFSDDSLLNVQQVKNVLDQIDVKSDVQQAIAGKPQTLNEQWNQQIEDVTGAVAGETVSDVRARLEGKKKDGGLFKRFINQFTITSSAADFLGLLYDVAGKGRQGDRHLKFINDYLVKPYNKAEQELLTAKTTIAADIATIKSAFPTIQSRKNKFGINKSPLQDPIGVGPFTKSHAVRVWLWNKQGTNIPGIDAKDINALVAAVENDLELLPFAENVMLVQKETGFPPPKNSYWIGGSIASDILNGLDTTYRSKLLTEWQENVDIIFSEENMNKLESVYGGKWVEAMRDSLRRMKSGSNRPVFVGSGARQVNDMLDWLNASVGNVMFLNTRSGLLQLISNVNFINWGDNNIYNASKAFASKEYVPTVLKLMNSDYLVNRRDGLKINVSEAELTEAATKGGLQGMISYLLDKGFVITRIMDSLAIATGGATFYINRRKSLLNRINEETGKKYTPAEAEVKAFDDFYAVAEETQQSSNPSKISAQQASVGGRVLLAFQNVTMQYNRKTKKMIQDFYNRRKRPGMTQRESDLSNISGVLYYVGIQNLIFNGLQNALFAIAFDDDDEDRKEQDKTARIANGMLDSLLNGLGFGGALISTVKNVGIRVLNESEKKSPKYIDAVDEVFNISPVIDAKLRKLKSAAKTFEWNMKDIKKKGWDLENPAYLAVSQIVSSITNIPIDRALRKGMNVAQAFDEETKTWQSIALLMGWSGWNLNLPYWGLESTIKKEAEQEEKVKKKFKIDVEKAKKNGFTKRVPFTGAKSGKPKGEEGVDYVAIQRYDGKIQYYKKP